MPLCLLLVCQLKMTSTSTQWLLTASLVKLLEVWQNLIDNGVKYMGDQTRPRIEIGSRRDGHETVCYVRDNGIGIEPCYHEKIFGLFNQLDQNVDGSGIGYIANL